MRLRSAFSPLVCALSLVASLLLVAPAASAAVPAGFRDYVVFRGLNAPTTMEFAADGRVFVAEKSGLIKVFDNVDDATPEVFADLRTNVHDFWDRGLLGLALHPDFPATPYVYALYTYDAAIGGTAPRWGDACPEPPGATGDGCVVSGRLSRLQANGNRMAGAEQVLVEDWCQQYPSHSIAALEFGPDGMLYASAGDGASFNFVDYGQDGNPVNPCGDPPGPPGTVLTPPTAEGGALRSQDLRTPADPVGLNGTVIRVDPATGAGAAGNPLAGSADPNARRIIASGLRNPFRMAFRPGTSELYLSEVGWSSSEEINRIASPTDAAVDNFGWPCYEGSGRQGGYDGANLNICEGLYSSGDPVTAPVFGWSHRSEVVPGDGCGTGSSSASGIAFYDTGSYPDAYDGALFFTDYSRNCIWSMGRNASGALDPATRAPFVTQAVGPVDLEVGPNGDVYYVAINDGTIRRIGYSAGNQPPVAAATATPTSGQPPLTVAFDAAGSSDPDPGDVLTYAWDLDGDGAFDDSTAPNPSFTYSAAGPVTARLRVTDALGATDVAEVRVTVGDTAPVPVIATPAEGTVAAVGQTVTFSGSATDAQDGALPASALSWSANLYHCSAPDVCHRHPAFLVRDGVASGSFVVPDHERLSYVELTLTASSGGEVRSVTRRVDYRTTDLTFTTDPPGIPVVVGPAGRATPFTRTEHAGGTISVSAPEQAVVGGVTYRFASWSDGGARAHNLTVPTAPTTYTATYRPVPGTVLFDDRFEDGSADGWSPSRASWAVCRPPGASLEYCANTTADSFSLAGNAAWTDYSVESAVRMPTEAGGAMVLGRVQDGTHWYQFQLKKDSSGRDRWYIQRRRGSTWTTVASGLYDYSPNRYYHLRLTMVGSRLTGAISADGGRTFTTVGAGNDTAYRSGRIGLRSWSTSTTFDVVRVIAR
jgi:glucose/arabinose dehydrogenase